MKNSLLLFPEKAELVFIEFESFLKTIYPETRVNLATFWKPLL